MITFVKPSLHLLKSLPIVRREECSLDVYCSPSFLLRELFWLRLRLLIFLINRNLLLVSNACLDFGGGSGILALSLATGFNQVELIDLRADESKMLIDKSSVRNVTFNKANVIEFDYGP